MFEYVLQTVFLLGVLFVYMLSGSVVYSAIGEGYKATPLRCFSVGVGLWVLLVILSTIFLPINLEMLWWGYVVLTLAGLFFLPKQDQNETLDKIFFYQVIVSFVLLIPAYVFLQEDKLHLWQEFAIYAKGLFSLSNNGFITNDLLSMPLAYQLSILPVSYFTEVQTNIFACFNVALLAFVACEFVRNSGVRIQVNNVLFPLAVAFGLLVVINPFSIRELTLSADPFIFICAIGFAFAEYIFRAGHLPKNIAAFAPAIILMLLSFSSTQGFLLAFSLFLVFLLRALIQSAKLNHKQYIGVILTPMLAVFVLLFWQFYLNQKGLGFLLFDSSKVTVDNIQLVYKAIFVLAKENVIEFSYIAGMLALGLYSLFTQAKTLDDVIIGKYLVRPVFWIMVIYLFICVPIFFSQYEYVARASYSLGFTTICLIQFIILMPVGRIIKEKINTLDFEISPVFKLTVVTALIIMIVMNREYLTVQQNAKVSNVLEISSYVKQNITQEGKVAVLDIKKTSKFYEYVLGLNATSSIGFDAIAYSELPEGLEKTHKYLLNKNFTHVLMHAPNNLLIKNFEYNLNPEFSYLYEINKDGFYLVTKFENKLYKDTNILIK